MRVPELQASLEARTREVEQLRLQLREQNVRNEQLQACYDNLEGRLKAKPQGGGSAKRPRK